MLQLHCQIIYRFNNIMELIEETAETFCQVSADCRNVFPIVDQYLDSCSKLHSDLRMVSLSLGNFFQSLEHLSGHIADTKGKFKTLLFINKTDCGQDPAELLERICFSSSRSISLLSRNFSLWSKAFPAKWSFHYGASQNNSGANWTIWTSFILNPTSRREM